MRSSENRFAGVAHKQNKCRFFIQYNNFLLLNGSLFVSIISLQPGSFLSSCYSGLTLWAIGLCPRVLWTRIFLIGGEGPELLFCRNSNQMKLIIFNLQVWKLYGGLSLSKPLFDYKFCEIYFYFRSSAIVCKSAWSYALIQCHWYIHKINFGVIWKN